MSETQQQQVIEQMREEAYHLMQASKTPNGAASRTAPALALRGLSYKISRWANALEGKTEYDRSSFLTGVSAL